MQNAVVWITGAGSGIGKAIALRFAREGHTVAASGRSREKLDALAAEFSALGLLLCTVICDVRDQHSVAGAWQKINAEFGRVDVLVNNAGVTAFTPFTSSTIEDFDAIVSTNLRGAFLCTQQALPGMLQRGAGTVIMINSIAARDVFRDSSVYAAAKAGLKAMTDCLRFEVRGSGVRVVSVFPGATNTPIWHERVREKHGDRMMNSMDVAELVYSAFKLPPSVMLEDIFMQPTAGPL